MSTPHLNEYRTLRDKCAERALRALTTETGRRGFFQYLFDVLTRHPDNNAAEALRLFVPVLREAGRDIDADAIESFLQHAEKVWELESEQTPEPTSVGANPLRDGPRITVCHRGCPND